MNPLLLGMFAQAMSITPQHQAANTLAANAWIKCLFDFEYAAIDESETASTIVDAALTHCESKQHNYEEAYRAAWADAFPADAARVARKWIEERREVHRRELIAEIIAERGSRRGR